MKNYIKLLAVLFIFLSYGYSDVFYSNVRVPDVSFEKTLIFMGVDSDMKINGLVKKSDIKQIKSLDLSDKGIYDLRGIEKFTALEQLNVSKNNLQRLDVGSLKNLKKLDCSSNSLLFLDIRKTSSFKKLKYSNNPGIQVSWY